MSQIVHVRWSGESMWMPLSGMVFNVPYEDANAYPTPGQLLLYSSETEIIIAYSSADFASKAGTLTGNHFAGITSDLDKLREVGVSTLSEGYKYITFSKVLRYCKGV